MTESKPPAYVSGDDATARVLAAAKSLHDGFEGKYAATAVKVKKEIEGPVKFIDTEDDIPITMQLSVWDTKMGPKPAMLVGGAVQLATVTSAEQEDTTRLMDFLELGESCDLSKDGHNRLLLKFGIADSRARGGDAWLSLAIYYTQAVDVPKPVIEELLKETARSWHGDASLAAEALAIREAYNPAVSRWREYLQEIRLSVWALVQKAHVIAPPTIPGIVAPAVETPVSETFPAEGDASIKRKKKAKPNPDAEEAGIFSKLARATIDAKARAKQAIDARIAAHKKVVVPPVADVVSQAVPGPEPPASLAPPTLPLPSPLPVALAPVPVPTPAPVPDPVPGTVAPGFPTAPPHLVAAPAVVPTLAPAPPAIAIDTASEEQDAPIENIESDEIVDQVVDPASDPLSALEAGSGAEPVPVQITITKPVAGGVVTPQQPAASLVPPKRLAAIEAGLIEVLGKLQRSGYSLKVNKETGEATACKLVELDPGKGGLLALVLSFHATFLPHAVLHEIDGRFFAGDERVVTVPYRPTMRVAIASHLQGAVDIVYRGKSMGKLYKNRPLKPVIVPVVLVRSAIKGTGADIPFKWVEPNPADGIEHGHLVVAAPEIDRAEAFVMNSVRVLGPRMVAAEAQHVEATGADMKKSSQAGWGATLAVMGLGAVGLLASAHLLPVAATIAILQYWYVLAAAIVLVLVAGVNVYQKLDQRVNRAIDARLQEVTNRTPLLVKPDWPVLIDAARRIGKADFGEFKAAFCQELDPLAVDETVEVVWQQDASRVVAAPKEAIGALDALAKSAKKAKITAPASAFAGGLKVTDATRPAKPKKVDDDTLNEDAGEEPAGDPAETGDAPDEVHFDPLASLKGR